MPPSAAAPLTNWRRPNLVRFELLPIVPSSHLAFCRPGHIVLRWLRQSLSGPRLTREFSGSLALNARESASVVSGVAETAAPTVLQVEDLQTHFFTATGQVRAVDGVSYALKAGETLGVVGESGCGKSVTALSILRLVADPPGKIVGGTIRVEGRDLLGLDSAEMEW